MIDNESAAISAPHPVVPSHGSKMESIQGVFKFMLKRMTDYEKQCDARFSKLEAEVLEWKTKFQERDKVVDELQKTVELQKEQLLKNMKNETKSDKPVIDKSSKDLKTIDENNGFMANYVDKSVSSYIFPVRRDFNNLESGFKKIEQAFIESEAQLDTKLTNIECSTGKRFKFERETTESEISNLTNQCKILKQGLEGFVKQINNQLQKRNNDKPIKMFQHNLKKKSHNINKQFLLRIYNLKFITLLLFR